MKKLYLTYLLFLLSCTAFSQFTPEEVIGNTYSLLQSNSGPCNSIVTNNNSISAVWTYSPDSLFSAQRGTGYNYFDGSSWDVFSGTRIETIRTGFPNIGITGSGKEIVVSHYSSGINCSSRTVAGSGNWSNTILPFNSINTLWPRMAIGGTNHNSVHIICNGSGVSGQNYLGQDGPLLYSRSDDEGDSWSVMEQILPGTGSSDYLGFDGDNYVIDAKGSNIAILLGSTFTDLILLKSQDNGNTWTKQIIETFPVPFYDTNSMLDINGDGIPDTLMSHSGGMDVVIDPSDTSVHVVFRKNRFYCDASTPGSFNYFPFTDTLYYWNDRDFTSDQFQTITGPVDLNGNGQVDHAGFYNNKAIQCPAISIYNGVPLVFFCGMNELSASGGNTRNQLFYTYRQFTTFTSPRLVPTLNPLPSLWNSSNLNINYVALNKNLTGCGLDFIYVRDTLGSSASTFQNAQVVHGQMDACVLINSLAESNDHFEFSVFPNPANQQLYIHAPENGLIEIADLTGKTVKKFEIESFKEISVSDLTKGFYSVRFTSSERSISRKAILGQ